MRFSLPQLVVYQGKHAPFFLGKELAGTLRHHYSLTVGKVQTCLRCRDSTDPGWSVLAASSVKYRRDYLSKFCIYQPAGIRVFLLIPLAEIFS